ncbi:MAG: permease-like cell division protein FtsX [Prevotella sp.]|nr:permease-like cell division protein FtsX [Bacteroidales bacterium]MDY4230165.1 permease-like cell division protein FtsX [Prevotella sp.]MCI6102761.1 permease-like cell division protein FtsX [Bacteroidales bacterium]MCI7598542.1 permease-like cell division protein FtsX [Bacteroidales bacterium]MCI7653462.1 permease-like cell division protein FtsX [Bacteroidales bacterium]
MGNKRNKVSKRSSLQAITLCISIALVLILLGIVVFFGFTGRNLSNSVKENFVVTMMFEHDMTTPEAQGVCQTLTKRPYIKQIQYVSKEQALAEATKEMGIDPTEFTDGENPYQSSIELTMRSAYANNDSLAWISKELKKMPKVTEVNYQKGLIEVVNRNLAKIGFGLLFLAVLLTLVSFSLINNTVRLGIYARRFSIHTMKLVGASWGFIRRPFVMRAVVIGFLGAVIANLVLAGCFYALYSYDPEIMSIATWDVLAITAGVVFLFGIIITALCANISVSTFLKMKAGELYKI